MKILVCLKEAIDPALALDAGLENPVLFGRGLPRRLDAASAAALAHALEMKAADSAVEIIAVSIGHRDVEKYLRDALAFGAAKAERICDEGPNSTPFRKALLLAGAASLEGADMIFTGARSLDTASGQVAGLVAARLGWPCVLDAVNLEMEGDKKVILVRDVGRGEREKVRCPLPAIVGFKGEGKLPYASLEKLIESRQSPLARVNPADLGIAAPELNNDPTRSTGPVFPRPRPRKAPPLDSSLPAFERILQLLQGGISRRRGLVLTGDAEAMAGRLFELLKEAGVLKPAAKK
jgi:electron transfer flavoprotein beta subunit